MIRHLFLLIIGVALIYTGSYFMDTSIKEKEVYNLTSYSETQGEAPEIMIATKLLGGFRGILIDVLWIRALNLEQEGKYFELSQLFDLISKLEPRVPAVWSYASWNLAYNVSKEVPEVDQKWEWIKSGARLLQNKGLKYCPREYRLYEELAYIYYHKIGGVTDESNHYYKETFALEMDRIFGDHFDVKNYVEVQTLRQIESLPDGKEILKLLKDKNFLSEIFRVLAKQIVASDAARDFLKQYQDSDTFKAAIRYYRRELIEDTLNMDITTMKELEDEFGKMEWRSGICFGFYWVFAGKKNATAQTISMDRMETYILKDIFFFGSAYAVYDQAGKKHFEFAPDYTKAEIVHKRYLHYLEKYPSDEVSMTFYYAYRQFLETICIELYMRGEMAQAAKYYEEGKVPLHAYHMPNTVKEFIDEAFKKALGGRTDQEHILMIYSPLERYYKDKFILQKADSNEQFFTNFIVKNYKEWAEKEQKNKLPLPPSLKEIQVLVLQSMLERYKNVKQENLDLLQAEYEKLRKEVNEIKKEKQTESK